jgi:hypothetical protein
MKQFWKMAGDSLGSMSSLQFRNTAVKDASTADERWYLFELVLEHNLNPLTMGLLYAAFPNEYRQELITRLLNVEAEGVTRTVLRCASARFLLDFQLEKMFYSKTN